jgi:hypothetical protein
MVVIVFSLCRDAGMIQALEFKADVKDDAFG